MNDTAIVDWLENQAVVSYNKGTRELTIWNGNGFILERTTIEGPSLRECVIKAMGEENE